MSAPFTEENYRALLDLEATLTALEETPGWQTLKAEVSRVVEEDRRRLLGGYISDHEDYLKTAWRIRGADSVLGFPEATRQRLADHRRLMADREGGNE